ncbi:MAG: radical SAM protein [Clostridiales bacterium]|nr:radical SAM protein [Clostridiales bacterium]
MTDKCSAACKICCFSCTPNRKKLLSKERMKEYIRQANEIGTFNTVSYSGGEAILYYGQLKECMEYAKSFGMKSTLVSNGFWGADYDKGYEMMKGLKNAGLSDISISVDQFHQEYVPLEAVKNAIRITEKLGVLSTLTAMDLADGKSSYDVMDRLRPEIYGKDIIVYPCFPAGAAGENIPEDQFIMACKPDTAICPYNNDIITMFDGSMLMCCSQFSRDIPMTYLGRFETDALLDIVENFNDNDFRYVLLQKGFAFFTDLARKLHVPLQGNYCVACHLCRELFGNKAFVEAAEPYVTEEADRMRVRKLLSVS